MNAKKLEREIRTCKHHGQYEHAKTCEGEKIYRWKCIKCRSDAVSENRRIRKRKLVELFGDTCGICKKTYHYQIYNMHHVNPKEKEFNVCSGNTISWDKTIAEAKKCVMLCSNCHRELELGLSVLPKNIKTIHQLSNKQINKIVEKFDRKAKIYQCKQCGKETKNKDFCTPRCFYKKSEKISWPEPKKLLKMVQDSNYVQVGKKLGVSDNAVRKHLEKLKL